MFEQVFRKIDDILRKEAGCTTELDYTEQTSWLLFLKYLDELEHSKAADAALQGKPYTPILDEAYRWVNWTVHHAQCDFVHTQLFPYLAGFKQRAPHSDTLDYKIGEIFGEITNKIYNDRNLQAIIAALNGLRFRSQAEQHELSYLYEAKIKNMGNAGRNGGEYYTPRALIRAMVQVIAPRIGEQVYDGACGSAGFLCEAYDYLAATPSLTAADWQILQTRTLFGKEKKSLAYVIAVMNLVLHGIDVPNVLHTNTLSEHTAAMHDRDRYDVVLANPPFGGKEDLAIQQNFPVRSSETAFLFLQHFIACLKPGGRAAVVIKNTFLSNVDHAAIALRKHLLAQCRLHTVLDCPAGTFLATGVKTVVLFFEKGSPTESVWYYQLTPGRILSKTKPLNDDDLREFVALQAQQSESPCSWLVPITAVDATTYSLAVKNPHTSSLPQPLPQEILAEIAALDAATTTLLASLAELV